MRRIASACPLDCPDACSLAIEAEDGRIVSVDGGTAHALTDGFICGKVRNVAAHVDCAERILHPGVRSGRKGEGLFTRVSWEEALGLVAGRIDEVRRSRGGEAILPFYYGGSNGYLTQDALDARLFRRLGASRLARTFCAAATGAAATGLYGKMAGVALPDYAHARLIVLWGVNPSASGIHLVPVIQQAMRDGARLVVIDPRRTPLAKRADLHLAVRPGADLPVALAVIRWLFAIGAADRAFLARHATGAEELERRAAPWTFERAADAAGVAAEAIERLAQLYAEASPAVIRLGWGLERNRNGGSAAAAILALPAVAGKFGVRGGGYTMSNSAVWKFTALASEPEPPTRIVNQSRLGEALLEARPPIEVLFVYNANPLMTAPRQEVVREGLSREDLFTVVHDAVMTDTARYADVLLPATTFLEHRDLSRGYGAIVVQEVRPAIPPRGESRPNYEVFGELCRRLGVTRPGEPEDAEALTAAILEGSGRGAEFRRALDAENAGFPECGPAPVQFADVFPRTADEKIHLCPPALDAEAPHGLYAFQTDPGTRRFPLVLVSPATERTISSTFGQLHRKRVPLDIHPEDAAARGVLDGDAVRVFNEQGDVRCHARVSDEVRPGVVSLPKGLWSHNTANGRTANALVPDTLSDIGAGACYNDARVEVERDRGGGGR